MSYRTGTVAVDGGDLTYGAWGESGPLVVAIHGITSHHLAFGELAPMLSSDHRIVAPDLRGRGRSRDLPAPYGMERHAADVAALVEAHGESAVVVGHSMGCWVALELARQRPDLVERLVLVDGGAPLPLPPGLDSDASKEEIADAITAVVGVAYQRLSMTFADRDAYREHWRQHPALHPWTPAVEAYVDYDLVGEPPAMHPACRLEAAVEDGRQLFAYAGVEPETPARPAVFLRAERGMLDEDTGMYAPGYPQTWLPGVPVRDVAGVNHYTIVLAEQGARTVLEEIRRTHAA